MAFWIRLLIVAAVVLLVLRRLRLLVGAARPRAHVPPTSHGSMVRDPVCGMHLDPALAVRVNRGREAYFFCSEECRKTFLASRS